MPPPDTRDRVLTWAIIAGTALLLVAIAPAMQLWDRDEPLYARIAVEMLRSGQWLVPTFNGDVFADNKGPLGYWMMAVSIWLIGETAFAARLPSVLGMTVAVAVTGAIARQWCGLRTARWAMVVLATSASSVYLGAAALHDAVLLATITVMFWAWLRLRSGHGVWGPLCWLAGALALSLLAKGPVGPAIFGSVVGVTWLARSHDEQPTRTEVLAVGAAAIIALGLFLTWAIPANTVSGGRLWREGVGVGIVGQALAPRQGHGGTSLLGYLLTLPFYVPVVVGGLLPWAIDLLPALVAAGRRRLIAGSHRVVILAWIATTFGLFTLAVTKLPHYVFPLFPAAAILLAAYHTDAAPMAGRARPRLERVSDGVYGVLMAGLVIALIGVAWWLSTPGALGLAAAIAGTTVVFLRWRHQGHRRRAHILASVGMPLCVVLAYWGVAPAVETVTKSAGAIALTIRTAGHADLPVLADSRVPPSVIFELRRRPEAPVEQLPDSAAEALARLEHLAEAVLIIDEAPYDTMAAMAGPHRLEVLSRHTALDINQAARRTVRVVAHWQNDRRESR